MSPAVGRDDTEQPRRSHSFLCLVWRQGESTEFLLLLGYAYLYGKRNYLFGTFSLLLKNPQHCYFYSCFKCGRSELELTSTNSWSMNSCLSRLCEKSVLKAQGVGRNGRKRNGRRYWIYRHTAKIGEHLKRFLKIQQKKLSTVRKIKWPLIAQETFPRTHTAD